MRIAALAVVVFFLSTSCVQALNQEPVGEKASVSQQIRLTATPSGALKENLQQRQQILEEKKLQYQQKVQNIRIVNCVKINARISQ